MINNQREYIIAMAQVVKLQCEFVSLLQGLAPDPVGRGRIRVLESEIDSLHEALNTYRLERE